MRLKIKTIVKLFTVNKYTAKYTLKITVAEKITPGGKIN